jgi:hypothetical protein
MASSINASTSGAGGVITTADNTGILNLQSAGTTVAALASTGLAITGTLSASGAITATGGLVVGAAAAPTFSAYRTTNQSITTNTFTKILWTAEEFDTNNNFASSAFTPTVAGYYLIVAGYNPNGGGTPSRCILDIFKNGNQVKRVFDTSARCDDASGSCLVNMNGTTDYVEAYAYIIATSPQIYGTQSDTYFQGFLARSA